MKKFLLFLLVAFSFVVNAQHVTPHVTTVHPTTIHVSEPVNIAPHVTEVHALPKATVVHETPVYSPIKEVPVSDFKVYPNGTYYYLMMNNHTKQYDTVKGATKEELKAKLTPTKAEPPMSNGTMVSIIIALIFCIAIIAIIVQTSGKKEKTWEEAAKELDPNEDYNKVQ